ncbi:MAG: hypothetical protein ABR600_06485 [Actinomycetota bacterium]
MTGKTFRFGAGLLLGLALMLGAFAVSQAETGHLSLEGPHWLADTTERIAAANGDPNAAWAKWSLISAREGDPLIGLDPNLIPRGTPSRMMDVVIVRGSFTDAYGFEPCCLPARTGNYLILAFNPVTHKLDDFGIGNRLPESNLWSRFLPLTLFDDSLPWWMTSKQYADVR